MDLRAMSGDWGRVLAYVVQAVEDQRRADELAARAHAGRVMAKKIIDMKLGGARDRDAGGRAHPVARICRRQGSSDGKGDVV
jgi:hypothetical protein